jgi:hypothetical protein
MRRTPSTFLSTAAGTRALLHTSGQCRVRWAH